MPDLIATPSVLRRWAFCGALAIACTSIAVGCGESKPRPRKEIIQEQVQLDKLYITGKSAKRIVAPGDKGVFIDPETNEIAFPAVQCHNPDCPARKEGGEGRIFAIVDPTLAVESDGRIWSDEKRAGAPDEYLGQCPDCLKIRDFKSESPEQKQKYIDYVKPYVLPESAARNEELEKELILRQEMIKDRVREANQ